MEFKEDPKFSVIVPVYDVPQDVFKRCLLSISDQDYGNLEVVIVPNGGDRDAEKMALEFAEGKSNWKVIFTEEKGACNARNLGFKESTGEIVSFTNSDYILNPGCIRMWVDKLQENPDCGFVYGAYEYNAKQRDVYDSKDFDIYQLEVANYIDCGFPLWRKYVVEWDSEVKSLQDWDFWLRVVKSGVKGHYLGREISYIAEYPRPKGLSMDSSSNWVERVNFVKEKNGIPIRDICVCSLGAPNHAVQIAKMIGADFRDDTLHKPHEYKSLYLIGWYMRPGEAHNSHSDIVKAFPNSRKILHFVGADIYWLRKFSKEQISQWSGAMKLTFDHILSENEAAQEELRSYGLDSEIVPIPPYSDFSKVLPYPKEFSVALYLTDKSDFDKYLQEPTLSIVKAMPDIKFYGYGDAQLQGFKAKNFEHKGFLKRPDWEKFVEERSAYLRIVKHDTRPMASDEFIMAGRSVITNIPAPYMDVIDTSGTMPFDSWDKFSPGFNPLRWPETKTKIVQKIREVKKRTELCDGENMANRLIASSEYRELLSKETFKQKILNMALAPKLEVVNA
jgi:glycosyltransferase involved in cell wall biosynthesis